MPKTSSGWLFNSRAQWLEPLFARFSKGLFRTLKTKITRSATALASKSKLCCLWQVTIDKVRSLLFSKTCFPGEPLSKIILSPRASWGWSSLTPSISSTIWLKSKFQAKRKKWPSCLGNLLCCTKIYTVAMLVINTLWISRPSKMQLATSPFQKSLKLGCGTKALWMESRFSTGMEPLTRGREILTQARTQA